jgi:hypothetical protein
VFYCALVLSEPTLLRHPSLNAYLSPVYPTMGETEAYYGLEVCRKQSSKSWRGELANRPVLGVFVMK